MQLLMRLLVLPNSTMTTLKSPTVHLWVAALASEVVMSTASQGQRDLLHPLGVKTRKHAAKTQSAPSLAIKHTTAQASTPIKLKPRQYARSLHNNAEIALHSHLQLLGRLRTSRSV